MTILSDLLTLLMSRIGPDKRLVVHLAGSGLVFHQSLPPMPSYPAMQRV